MDVEMKIKNGYRYPIYPNVAHGDTMYNDIRNYLISKKNKSYRANYSYYIDNAIDSENQKRYFRNRASLYDINDYNELMAKVYIKKK